MVEPDVNLLKDNHLSDVIYSFHIYTKQQTKSKYQINYSRTFLSKKISLGIIRFSQDVRSCIYLNTCRGGWGILSAGMSRGVGFFTIPRHLLQNLSPGLITFPHTRQERSVEDWVGAGVLVSGIGFVVGCDAIGGSIFEDGIDEDASGWDPPQLRQNLSEGATDSPHPAQYCIIIT